jgi:hypothetical protein
MKVHDFDETYLVYYSALDRIVKKREKQIYETYHITVIEGKKVLTINTVDFEDLDTNQINDYIKDCGLVYKPEQNAIFQKQDENQVVEDDQDRVPFVLADRLSISGYINDTMTYNFEKAAELNEIMLEHDIPVRFTRGLLETM